MERNESRKLVVAKGEYLRRLGGKVVLASAGTLLRITGLIGASLSLAAVILIVLLWVCNWSTDGGTCVPLVIGSLLLFVTAVFASCYAVRLSGRLLAWAGDVQTGVPLTRHSEQHLAAEQILVRGSRRGLEATGEELLRGSVPAHGRVPQDELLRAAAGAMPDQ